MGLQGFGPSSDDLTHESKEKQCNIFKCGKHLNSMHQMA